MRQFWLSLLVLATACPDDTGGTTSIDTDTGTPPPVDTDTEPTTDDTDEPPPPPPEDPASIRFLNVSEALGVSTFVVDGSVDVDVAPFAATPYRPLSVGPHEIGMAPEPKKGTSYAAKLDLVAKADGAYLVLAHGVRTDIVLSPVLEDTSSLAADKNRLWIVHAAWGGPTIDVVDLENGMIIADELSYGSSVTIDWQARPLTLGVDVGNDGADWTYEIPTNNNQVFVPLVFSFADTAKNPTLTAVTLPPQPPPDGGAIVIGPSATASDTGP